MKEEIVELHEDVSGSPLYSEDLAPVPLNQRTWRVWDLAAIWVGMAVCIPTYLLASYMIKEGLMWYEALIIIGLANLVVTVPMIFNGHAGVKYGIPFPVLGRASFGIRGVHVPAIVRALVACGWFGIQTWIGGLAFYAIWCAATGEAMPAGLTTGKFVCFLLFWSVNVFFIWKGTESIRWLEDFSAPILILIGLFLIYWGATRAKGFAVVLDQSRQLTAPTAQLSSSNGIPMLTLIPINNIDGLPKASDYQIQLPNEPEPGDMGWRPLPPRGEVNLADRTSLSYEELSQASALKVRFRAPDASQEGAFFYSSPVAVTLAKAERPSRLRTFLFWLTAMVGFWATMSISIADITRYARRQKSQIAGQLIGLPGTMVLYSFVGIFVTCASLINFNDILVGEDAPWDPVSLIARFQAPVVVIIAQIFMLIATLSTNIAANVIAPANAFANAFPKRVSFRVGGVITGLIGIAICPWWLLNEISGLLIFVSGLLGPVLGILIADYFFVRKTDLELAELYKPNGRYRYGRGFNPAALIALAAGVIVALIGFWIPKLAILYDLSWFSGFAVALVVYVLLMKAQRPAASPS